MFEVRDPSSLAAMSLRAADAVTVPTLGLDQVPLIPDAGTLLRVGDAKDVWVISGGVRRIAPHICSGGIVDQLPPDPHILDAVPIAPGSGSTP